MSRRGRGMSLLEIIVAMAIFSLVTTAALDIYLPSLDRFVVADTAFDAQRNALTATALVAADLRASSASLLMIQAGPTLPVTVPNDDVPLPDVQSVAIPTGLDRSGTLQTLLAPPPLPMPNAAAFGTPLWQGWIEYWPVADPVTPKGFNLMRRVRYVNPFQPYAAGEYPFQNGPTSDARLVAGAVNYFHVDPVPYTVGLGRVQIQLRTVRYLHDRPTSFEGVRDVEMLY